MTMSINELKIAGFVGGEVKTGQTQAGKLWVAFNLCHTKKGKDGAADIPTWVRVKCFGWSAENAKVFAKGDNVIAIGELQIEKFKNKEGVEQTVTSLFAQQVGKINRIPKTEGSGIGGGGGGLDDIPFGPAI